MIIGLSPSPFIGVLRAGTPLINRENYSEDQSPIAPTGSGNFDAGKYNCLVKNREFT